MSPRARKETRKCFFSFASARERDSKEASGEAGQKSFVRTEAAGSRNTTVLLRSCKTVDVQVTESLSLRKENQHETHCLVLVLL
jgi:hypothetical protein